MKQITKLLGILFMICIITQTASAELKLDRVQFDPAIISAGDEVDIIIQYHDQSNSFDYNNDNTFKVLLEADDTLTQKYVLIEDSEGDNTNGRVVSGEYYNKVFRIKVQSDAPAGNYEFKLSGQWYKDGKPLDGQEYARFKMIVKKEGININVVSIKTTPAEVRPGDDFVKISTYVENVGKKDAKSVTLDLNLPKGFESSYTNNNHLWIGRLNSEESKEATFFVNVDENLSKGVYNFKYDLEYIDEDDNTYSKEKTLPFLVKSRPNLEISKVEGTGYKGSTDKLYLTIKNIGDSSAESVDVRLLKQNSQPFDFDVRSDYIGELEPGEEGLAVFNIKTNRDAEIKGYNFKILIRAKGDSDDGDDNIYTFNRNAKFNVIGEKANPLIGVTISLTVIIILFFGYKMIRK